MPHRLGAIADHLNATLHRGDPEAIMTGFASIEQAVSGQISFLSDATQLKKHQSTCKASALLVPPECAEAALNSMAVLVCDGNLRLAYARLAQLFAPTVQAPSGVHETARIGQHCQLGHQVFIGPYVIVGDGAVIGDGVAIDAASVLGAKVVIGDRTRLGPHVVLHAGARIGSDTHIHTGARIGQDGFGFAKDTEGRGGSWVKIPQLGGLCIGDHVEIGANTTIDRGALSDTVIEEGVKIDNQVQIAHNVFIGAHTLIAGCVGIAGSTRIGRHVVIGGGACINGHIDIADHVVIAGMAMVTRSIAKAGVYASGTGLQAHRLWRRNVVRFRELAALVTRVTALERRLKYKEGSQ